MGLPKAGLFDGLLPGAVGMEACRPGASIGTGSGADRSGTRVVAGGRRKEL